MDQWIVNDQYLSEKLVRIDNAQAKAHAWRENTNLPAMEVSDLQGKFLYLLTKMTGARRVLEIGTFYGYSAMWFAKALPDDGMVVSIEHTERFVTAAQKNIERAALREKITLMHGEADTLLTAMVENKEAAFDIIFIDAHKPSYPAFFNQCLQLSKSGTIIICDNILRNGELANMEKSSPILDGVRTLITQLAESDCVESTAMQMVGCKGHDGFTISRVK